MTIKDYYNAAAKYIGIKEGGNEHKEIINIYNTISPLPRGAKAHIEYAWCAIFVSAIAKKLGFARANFPYEMSCYYMYEWAAKNNKWRTSGNVGNLIIYDWKNNSTSYDHVGFIYDETANYWQVIEGNKSDSVGIRKISKSNSEIRGYIDIAINFSISDTNNNNSDSDNNGVANSGGSDNNNGVKYKVVKGDTLSKIAAVYGVGVADIVAANNIKNANLIYVGQVLTIPTNATLTAAEIERVARQVINGKFGNGETRKAKLAAKGYDYATIQAKVNEILYNR